MFKNKKQKKDTYLKLPAVPPSLCLLPLRRSARPIGDFSGFAPFPLSDRRVIGDVQGMVCDR